MTRVRRIAKRFTGWPESTRLVLESGCDYFSEFSDDKNDLDTVRMHSAWQLFGPEIMETWSQRNPGARPWGWWEYDRPAKSRRERTDSGKHPHDDKKYELPRLLWYGKPRFLRLQDMTAAFESEASFLKRLRLCSAAESKLI